MPTAWGERSSFRGRQWQVQPGQADVAFHVTGAVASRGVAEKRQAIADPDDGREADALL